MTSFIDLSPRIQDAYRDARREIEEILHTSQSVSAGSLRAASGLLAEASYWRPRYPDTPEKECRTIGRLFLGISDDWKHLYSGKWRNWSEEYKHEPDLGKAILALEELGFLLFYFTPESKEAKE